jgi:sec-independent protein translocase protein TatC
MADVEMPLTEHLEELRRRLFRILLAVGIGFGIAYGFADRLFAFLILPLEQAAPDSVALIGTGVAEAFVASPAIFYQLWAFVAPGLHDHEKYWVIPFVLFGSFFFIAGAAFCYSFVFQVGFRFFLEQYETISIEPTLRISEYLSFSSRLLLAFGVTFELPVLAFFFARVGLIDHNTLLRPWRYALIGIFVLAAILTPADIASQLLLAAPLSVLYVLSIGVAYVFARRAADESNPDD